MSNIQDDIESMRNAIIEEQGNSSGELGRQVATRILDRLEELQRRQEFLEQAFNNQKDYIEKGINRDLQNAKLKEVVEFARDWYKDNFRKPGEEHSNHPVYIKARDVLKGIE